MRQDLAWMRFFGNTFLVITGVVIAIAVGLRPSSVGTDTIHYIERFRYFVDDRFNSVNYEWLVGCLALFSAGFIESPRFFFTLLAGIDLLLVGLLARKLVQTSGIPIQWLPMVLWLAMSFMLSPFFFAVMVNVIRCGPALLLVYMLYITWIHKKNLWQIPLLIGLIWGFHRFSLVMIVFAPAIFLRMRHILALTMVLILLYLTGAGQWIVQSFSALSGIDLYTKIIGYPDYANPATWLVRIRWDFVIFSIVMGSGAQFLAWFLFTAEEQQVFFPFTKIYWILTWPFFIAGFGPYSDRFIYPAWLFLSILSSVFAVLYFHRYTFFRYIFWLWGGYTMSVIYFLLRVQGYLIFKK